MNRSPTLTLAFLKHAPASAAQVLEQLEAAEAAAFLEDIPARLATPAVNHMSSWSAARCLELMTPHGAAAILQGLAFHDSVGLLRLIDAGRHEAIYAELPTGRAKRLKRALRYAPGSIGAWMDPDVPTFASDAAIPEATKYLRQCETASHIFLHDPESGQYRGAVSALSVLRREAGTRLHELPAASVTPLSSRATLASAAVNECWDDCLVLPVVGGNRMMVGGLSRGGFRKGLADRRGTRPLASQSVLAQLVVAFGVTVNALIRLALPAAAGNATRQEQRHG